MSGDGTVERSGRGRRSVRVLWWTLAVFVALLLVALTAFAVWALTPYRAEPGPLARAERDPAVVVERLSDGVLISPAGEASGTGVVFYPGARVEADAYVASWVPVVAESGATVVIPDLRLNLALLDSARAESAVEAAPEATEWYLGGHSMGGAFAALHVGSGNGDTEWQGLVLWATYAVESAGLAERDDLEVLSVAGGRDGILPPEEVAEHRPHLPEDARTEVVEGMNHAQFGAYGAQSGDAEPELDDERAHEAVAGVTAAFLLGG
ncbi:alpha/beta hydrolase [Nocardiopsis sp. NPDC007018]|uniref:alpha/beta hydrolase n=1 Tax=Nocardiopsis sp. NPDC007018 TaxID=3155721 RepID=UPI00340D8333